MLFSGKVLKQLKKPIKTILWSDSQIVLHWMRSLSCIGSGCCPDQFVKRRVEEILELSEASNWYYCPSKENPADILSRGSSVDVLKEKTLGIMVQIGYRLQKIDGQSGRYLRRSH